MRTLLLTLTVLVIVQNSKGQNDAAKDTVAIVKFDDTSARIWSSEFKIVHIPSTIDTIRQPAYFYKSTLVGKQPLIVSLHTWSGDYTQTDPLAGIARDRNYNYIHPDFRGPNNTYQACCSRYALQDIDDAISYAIKNSSVDLSRIYVIGVSGGGYATLTSFMQSKHRIRKYSAWVPITDLRQWFGESRESKNGYWKNILLCTGSQNEELDVEEAGKRSPMNMNTPVKKLKQSRLDIFAGVNDGVEGSVPITHTIGFYNKILRDLGVKDEKYYVSKEETGLLLKYRKPLVEGLEIGGRSVCLKKEYKNVRITIFMGGHEMLPEFAFRDLIED